uniref:non-specific serine/threonine protein kinase n=1 Tax=Populus alba TaxID=43335 RepID=A0A4U5N8Y7_POPAL|nr:hypothetical protein D5086_0000277400 [Populus alba]
MSNYFLNDELSKKTSIFGLRLWVVLGICVGAAIVLLLFLISLWLTSKRNKTSNKANKPMATTSTATTKFVSSLNNNPTIPNISKEIQEIRVDPKKLNHPDPVPESELQNGEETTSPVGAGKRIHIEIGKDHRISYPERVGGLGSGSGETRSGPRSGDQGGAVIAVPEVSHLGWGHWYTLRELEESTNYFADENVIGEGGYGIVYRGLLEDNTNVAVKNLLNNRMLVYEYVENGNLEQWLHGDVGPCSPLTWEIRINIIIGTAKGYVAPEYASTGMLNERSDVYSFGILIMEIISGRNPVDYSRPAGEVNLVEWLKTMVTNRNAEGVLDPRLPKKPSPRALKRALLVALRCVDPNAQKRPKMGHVVHMLEADEFPFRDDRRLGREPGRSHHDVMRMDKRVSESGDSSGYESGVQTTKSLWRKKEPEEQ